MVKKRFYRSLLMLASLLVPTLMTAQELKDTVDSISENSVTITQYDFKEFEWVNTCDNPKYAIVTKDGRKGIYDMELQKNITEIEFREIGYSRTEENEDSTLTDWFYAKKGIKRGIVCVFEKDNSIMSVLMDDPDELYSLDECTTIDKRLTKKTTKLVGNLMKQKQVENVQLVVLDAKSGRLKTWVRLDRDTEKEEAGKLLVHSCAGSLTKPFHTIMALENNHVPLDSICNGKSYRQAIRICDNLVMQQAIMNGYRKSVAERKWRALTDTGNPSTSPFIMAVGYNSLANNGTMTIPTLKGDSVNVEDNVFTDTNVENLREVLQVDRTASPQLAWLSDDTEWLGYATTENIYSEADKERIQPVGKQVQFAGLFPADHPQYTICVVADKQSLDVTPSIFKEVVNPLAKWLSKRSHKAK